RGLTPKGLQQGLCDAAVAIRQDSDMPWPLETVHYRREAVHGDDNGRNARRSGGLDPRFDRPLIGPEARFGALLAHRLGQAAVARYADAVRLLGNGGRIVELAIAINHQARVP